MNPPPDWIAGGDPIKTHWLGGTQEIPPGHLTWTTHTKWSDSSGSSSIELGCLEASKPCAVRLISDIVGTSRSLEGEVGWILHDGLDGEFSVPLVDPSQWSAAWRDFAHGKIDAHGLLQRIGESDDNRVFVFRTQSKSRQTILPWLFLATLLGVAVGFVLGRIDVLDQPSELPPTPPRNPPESSEVLRKHGPMSAEKESDETSNPGKYESVEGLESSPPAPNEPPPPESIVPTGQKD